VQWWVMGGVGGTHCLGCSSVPSGVALGASCYPRVLVLCLKPFRGNAERDGASHHPI